MREKFAEHEAVVGFGMFTRNADILVHVKSHYVLEPRKGLRQGMCVGETAYDSVPALTFLIKAL
jgi:hypothetical protein